MAKLPLIMLDVKKMTKTMKKTKKATKKKAVAKKKSVKKTPTRPSPFKLGDLVWVQYGSTLTLETIMKCSPPNKTEGRLEWHYNTTGHKGVEETDLYPIHIFTFMPTDVHHMNKVDIGRYLNQLFDADAVIFEVFRKGQRRPFCYYVIPSEKIYIKTITGVDKYGYELEVQVYACTSENLPLKLMPISSAPQEILTYLGVHIYGRRWIYMEKTSGSDNS